MISTLTRKTIPPVLAMPGFLPSQASHFQSGHVSYFGTPCSSNLTPTKIPETTQAFTQAPLVNQRIYLNKFHPPTETFFAGNTTDPGSYYYLNDKVAFVKVAPHSAAPPISITTNANPPPVRNQDTLLVTLTLPYLVNFSAFKGQKTGGSGFKRDFLSQEAIQTSGPGLFFSGKAGDYRKNNTQAGKISESRLTYSPHVPLGHGFSRPLSSNSNFQSSI